MCVQCHYGACNSDRSETTQAVLTEAVHRPGLDFGSYSGHVCINSSVVTDSEADNECANLSSIDHRMELAVCIAMLVLTSLMCRSWIGLLAHNKSHS